MRILITLSYVDPEDGDPPADETDKTDAPPVKKKSHDKEDAAANKQALRDSIKQREDEIERQRDEERERLAEEQREDDPLDFDFGLNGDTIAEKAVRVTDTRGNANMRLNNARIRKQPKGQDYENYRDAAFDLNDPAFR